LARAAIDIEAARELSSDVSRVGTLVQRALSAVIVAIGGRNAKPLHVSRKLGMDSTVVWRLVTASRASTPAGCLHGLPGPQSISMLFQEAERISPGAASGGAEALRAFEELLARFADGRQGLNAAIEGWLPEARTSGMRAAAQSSFRAMSQVLGCQILGNGIASIVVPSSTDGDVCDVIHVRLMHGIRRLRAGAPIALCSTPLIEAAPSEGDHGNASAIPTRVRVDGSEARRVSDLLLMEHCSDPLPVIATHSVSRALVMTLPTGSPRVNEETTLALGYRSDGAWQRYASERLSHEWGTYRYSVPSKWAVNDLLLHRDVWSGVLPEVMTHFQGTATPDGGSDRRTYELSRVNVGVQSSSMFELEPGCGALSDARVPGYQDAVAGALEAAGFEAKDFVGFRATMPHPITFMSLTWWYGLPERG
jgi:hypothetical protein